MELTIIEQSELEQLENIISKDVSAFYRVGNALAKIRGSSLYRETHETFEAYCKDRWDLSIRYSQMLIGAAGVIKQLEANNCSCLPKTESQTRPLTKLETAELQREAWRMVIDTAPDGKITARYVSKIVSSIRKDITIKEVNKNKAKAISISKEEMIDEAVRLTFDAFYREIQRAKMENWKNTSKEVALQLIELTKDLIEIT